MKDLYVVLTCDYATKQELKEVEVGSLLLKVNGRRLNLDTGTKIEIHNNTISVNVIGYGETQIEDWRELDYIDVEGEVWVESEVELQASLAVVGESTQMFDLKIS